MFLSENDQFSCPINQKPHTLSGANSQCLQVCLKAVLFSACSILFGMVCQSDNLWAAAMIGMDLSTWILEWLYISVMWFRPLLSHVWEYSQYYLFWVCGSTPHTTRASLQSHLSCFKILVNEIWKVSCVRSHRKNPSNKTLEFFWEIAILIFCNVKNVQIFAGFAPFLPSEHIFMTFGTE